MKRNILTVLLLAFCAVLLNSTAWADTKGMDMSEQCRDACVKTLNYLQKQGGKQAQTTRIDALRDCIKLCDTNVDLAKRNSPLLAQVEKVCADACKRCAALCEGVNDPQLKECAAMCNHCANSCEMHHSN